MVKNPPANAGDMRCRFNPWVRRSSWWRVWQLTPVFMPGESHGQMSLVGYSPWGCKTVRYNLRTKWKQILNESVNKKSTKLKPGSKLSSVQFSSVAQSCPTLCDPMNRSTPGLPVHHQLPEFTQTHVHRVSDAIQPSHPRLSPSPPAPNPSQHQSFFQWVNSSHEVAKVLEVQLQHHSFQRSPRADLL